MKYPLLLAGIAAAMSLIPIFGSILSSIPIVAVALISSGTFDLTKGVKVLAWIILIHLVEANFLNPKIMGNAAKIHPVLVVFALIAGEHSYGLVGALFAVPVASIIQTIFVYYRKRPRGHDARRDAAACRHTDGALIATVRRALQRRDDGLPVGAHDQRRAIGDVGASPGRVATSRLASTTTARSASCGMRRPLRCGSVRSLAAWQTGQSEIPSTWR